MSGNNNLLSMLTDTSDLPGMTIGWMGVLIGGLLGCFVVLLILSVICWCLSEFITWLTYDYMKEPYQGKVEVLSIKFVPCVPKKYGEPERYEVAINISGFTTTVNSRELYDLGKDSNIVHVKGIITWRAHKKSGARAIEEFQLKRASLV